MKDEYIDNHSLLKENLELSLLVNTLVDPYDGPLWTIVSDRIDRRLHRLEVTAAVAVDA